MITVPTAPAARSRRTTLPPRPTDGHALLLGGIIAGILGGLLALKASGWLPVLGLLIVVAGLAAIVLGARRLPPSSRRAGRPDDR
jgi:type IV secretory pathway TrbD component